MHTPFRATPRSLDPWPLGIDAARMSAVIKNPNME
jgi:hypothetical protein